VCCARTPRRKPSHEMETELPGGIHNVKKAPVKPQAGEISPVLPFIILPAAEASVR
jgi:hypothetical protein